MIANPKQAHAPFEQILDSHTRSEVTLWLEVGGRIAREGSALSDCGPAVLLLNKDRISATLEVSDLPPDWRERLRSAFPRATGANFANCIAAPGLLEGHAHLFLSHDTTSTAGPDALLRSARAHALSAAAAGVTWIRDCGDPFGINLRLRDQLLQEGITHPQIRACGAGIHRRKRYGKQLGLAVDDDAGLLEAARQRIGAGCDDVKIMLSGIVNFEKEEVPGEPQFSESVMKELVSLAHAHGRRVVVHASGDKAVRVAALARVDTVEHAYFVSSSTLELMAANRVTWLPTLAPVYAQWLHAEQYGHGDNVRQSLHRILQGHALSIARAAELGVSIAAGSDSGSPGVSHHGGAALEFRLLSEHGLSMAQAYASASCIAAERIGFEGHAGVQPGAMADFTILAHSPLADSHAFEALKAVVKGGRLSHGQIGSRS